MGENHLIRLGGADAPRKKHLLELGSYPETREHIEQAGVEIGDDGKPVARREQSIEAGSGLFEENPDLGTAKESLL